ncbi:benzoate 4-monooxygenase cytochrome p450 [Grosmannia clavigera kw1407]|uniref:Benzoate 4-monooxygenase cytochrome p450 n=1 Tax=Grosmannia clavigera (strain kw1407 / UAMH 11150) TaxID=655863 RepID=F0XRP4_GROCL|nr:benzoate 4-monooxygenase cytochrome p450 [Grosmannia clavigera kw1407]EFW99522.1 benzoate 4-monooxygenase cytochrome p450 [Grosmannia clavigera kw1407]
MAFLLALVVLVLLGIRAAVTVIRAHSSSLSLLPRAGLLAPYSRLLWAFPHEYRGTITLDLPKLHKKLGPLIHIGPGEVSFYSLEAYDVVHKPNGGFVKDPRTYGQFVQDGHPALFSITLPEEHAKRRRMMGQLLSRSKVPTLEGLMLHHIDAFVHALRRRSGTLVEAGSACRALEADIISTFSFGESLGAVDAWERGQNVKMVQANDEKATWMPLLTSFPLLCDLWDRVQRTVARTTGIQSVYCKALEEFDQWAEKSWMRATSEGEPSGFPNLIKVLTRSGLPAETALSEAKENLGPGTDTTSGSLAHILYALSKNKAYQETLFLDLAQAGFPTNMTALEGVPRLKACVKEGIRWAGTAAAMLPRIVPPEGVDLHGCYIPAGTVLTSSPIWYLRDEAAFPQPELFDPYRWISTDGTNPTENRLRDRYYIPFSKGLNICIGAQFAYYELYLSVAKVLRNYRLRSPSDQHNVGVGEKGWQSVPLPLRKEWVAAVPLQALDIILEPRF